MKHRLDKIANGAVVLLCALAIAGVVTRHASKYQSAARQSITNGLKVGMTLPILSTAWRYDNVDSTLAIFLNDRCHACLASTADYRSIGEVAEANSRVRVVGVVTHNAKEISDRLQLSFPVVQVDNFRRFGVNGTPTAILVDRTGNVKDFWVGKFTSTTRKAVQDLVRRKTD